MTSVEMARHRMYSQRLWGPPLAIPEEVVKWLAALQAQELPVARWSVAQRTHDVDAAAMDRTLAGGAILRTHVLRPTWHFVLPVDIGWMLACTGPRVHALNGPYCRKFELNGEVLAKSQALYRSLNRSEAQALEAATERYGRSLGVSASLA